MVTIIKKGQSKQTIEKLLLNQKATKKFDAKKHAGTIKLKETPLSIQKKLRDGWT